MFELQLLEFQGSEDAQIVLQVCKDSSKNKWFRTPDWNDDELTVFVDRRHICRSWRNNWYKSLTTTM